MKAANINMVRTSHYPPAEGFIELCDEMGMYVLDEVPMGFGGGSGDDPSFLAAGLLARAGDHRARSQSSLRDRLGHRQRESFHGHAPRGRSVL